MSLKTKLFLQAVSVGLVVGALFAGVWSNMLLGLLLGGMTFAGFLGGVASTMNELTK